MILRRTGAAAAAAGSERTSEGGEVEFENQLVVIPGGTGGLGQHVTGRFLAEGADVVVPFVSEQELYTFRANHADADRVRFERLNALDSAKVERFFERLMTSRGAPDVLVNLVGGYLFGPSVVESEPEHFTRMLNVNFYATFNLCRSALHHMLQRGTGKVVNMGAKGGLHGTAHHAAYSVAKSAVIRLTESLADEFKETGININCVLPSIINTPANRQDMPDADHSKWVAPEDLAEVIIFLASPRARAIHGACIPVYGRGG